jgi:hypothetical protein
MKMRFILLIIIAGIFSSCGSNDRSAKKIPGDVKNSGTSIQWLDSAKNYGNVNEGQKLSLSFHFKNTGSKPLIIESVTPTCGCTIADYPKEPIASGEEGEITGVFDSMGREGLQNKHLTVRSNAEPSNQDISFQVNVIPLPKGKDPVQSN